MQDKTDRFGVVRPETIGHGEATDAYFKRTEEALEYSSLDDYQVVAEITADQFSEGNEEIFAGLDNVIELLKGISVDMYAISEGSHFDGGPVMRIKGSYTEFGRYETAILGMLSEASGYATAARECVSASNGVPVLSFGSRHNHPATAAIMERAAYIGGVDGYSNTAASDELPHDPSGTMPHALPLIVGSGQAFAWFNEQVDESVPRVVIADTHTDEVNEVTKAVHILGDDLDGVRLDTTGSRRGDFEHIIREVRYHLDNEFGRPDVDIYVSGGLEPYDIHQLHELVDGFGVGSYISDAPSVDFSLDIVEVEGDTVSKRGKLPCVKDVPMTQFVQDGVVIEHTRAKSARYRAKHDGES